MENTQKKYRIQLKRYNHLITPFTETHHYVDIDIPDDIIERILEITDSEDTVAERILLDVRVFKN